MKTIILAGGYGSRLGQITETLPKPMVKIGNKPILWHIMKTYSYYGFNDFIVLLGYKGEVIKEYFYNFKMLNSDFCMDFSSGNIEFFNKNEENWKVTLVDTGVDTLKGGRIKKAESYIDDDLCMLTYGDGVANIDLKELLEFHKSHNKLLTITGVRPPSRFGELNVDGDRVVSFEEKPQVANGIINGGFMVFNRELFSYLTCDKDCDFEFGILEKLANQGEIMVFKHEGQWECVDTQRDVIYLNKLWEQGNAFWKIWKISLKVKQF